MFALIKSSMHYETVPFQRSPIHFKEKVWVSLCAGKLKNVFKKSFSSYCKWKHRFCQSLSVFGFWWGCGMKTKQFTHGLILFLATWPPWSLWIVASVFCLFLNNLHVSIPVYPPAELILLELLQSIRYIYEVWTLT